MYVQSRRLGRIATNNCGSTFAQTFAYDPFGNITKSGSIAWAPGYTASTNRYSLGGTSYDANGNLLNDGTNTYTWDAEGKPLTTVGGNTGNNTWAFLYDAFGNKVEWSVNGTYKDSYLYIGKFKLSARGQVADYSETPLPGGSVASVNGGATGIQLTDWLGTVRAFYTGAAVAASGAHAPFGETYAQTGGSAWAFTGQLGDGMKVNGTEYFPERQYRNSQGRFLSPDPIGMGAVDSGDPQTWNRYAYVANRPLNHVDALGLCDWGCDDGGGWGGWGGGPWGEQLPIYTGPPLDPSVIIDESGGFGGLKVDPSTGEIYNPDVVARLNCIANSLDSQFPGTNFQPVSKNVNNNPEVGGHMNGAFKDTVPTATANAIANDIAESSAKMGCKASSYPWCLQPGTRLDDGLHIPSGTAAVTPTPNSQGSSDLGVSAHQDLFNPNKGPIGVAGHVLGDFILGHIAQFFGADLDSRCQGPQ